jgi:serine/threonine-protein kinase
MAVPAALPIRETMVGRKYELDHRIGEGGMGLVFAGRDLELGRFVAIKKMRPELKLNARDKKRFMQEATLSAALHHPCIVEIYDIAEQNGEVYLIFEFVDGQTMDKRLDEGPMTAAELKPFLKYVCQALQFAHSKKVVHRDLKPSNIMLTRQGFAKVVDFGIAREIKDAASRLTNMDTSGTLAYMAPEQELGRFDARSDIYSLGATLYEALCAQHPFPGPNYLLQKEKHSFTPLAEAAPEAPREFRDAIERCLRYDPKDRYQSVAEFARDAGVA